LITIQSQLPRELLVQVGSRLADSIRLLNQTIPAVRDVMSNLRPAVLDEYGLEAALRTHLDTGIEMTVLRIAQEALFNIAKHSEANRAKLALFLDEQMICLIVDDDGRGFEADHIHNAGHGLNIMRERVEAVSGSFRITSIPGKGTKIEVKIPIQSIPQSEVLNEQVK
jgi:two-component system sensor histidine kinase UhpB